MLWLVLVLPLCHGKAEVDTEPVTLGPLFPRHHHRHHTLSFLEELREMLAYEGHAELQDSLLEALAAVPSSCALELNLTSLTVEGAYRLDATGKLPEGMLSDPPSLHMEVGRCQNRVQENPKAHRAVVTPWRILSLGCL